MGKKSKRQPGSQSFAHPTIYNKTIIKIVDELWSSTQNDTEMNVLEVLSLLAYIHCRDPRPPTSVYCGCATGGVRSDYRTSEATDRKARLGNGQVEDST